MSKQKQLTRSQELLVEAGFPASLFLSQEERKAVWDANPPKPMPNFATKTQTTNDQATLKLLAELEEQKKLKSKGRIQKMLDKKVDRTGQRWDSRKAKWIDLNATRTPMISITTNTRGATKMTKNYAEMTPIELVTAYNKISGKPPIKKFRDKATGLARMAELKSKKTAAEATGPLTGRPISEIIRKSKTAAEATRPTKKEGSSNKLAAEFNARVGTNREKVIIAFDEGFKKQLSIGHLLKAVYGNQNQENKGALQMVISGVPIMIKKYKLAYELKKEKIDGEITFGLYPLK